MEPTHELARQSYNVIMGLGEYMGVNAHLCIGGTKLKEEKEILRSGDIQVIVGTPGRVGDMLARGFIDLSYLKLFVLDEADDLLNRGF